MRALYQLYKEPVQFYYHLLVVLNDPKRPRETYIEFTNTWFISDILQNRHPDRKHIKSVWTEDLLPQQQIII